MCDTQALHHQQELEHQQHLLTASAYYDWTNDHAGKVLHELCKDPYASMVSVYLKEHGLPLTSRIEGL